MAVSFECELSRVEASSAGGTAEREVNNKNSGNNKSEHR